MVTKKTSSTTKAETATVKAEKKETAAAKAIETKKDTTKKLETKAAVLVDTPEVQAEEVKETVIRWATRSTTLSRTRSMIWAARSPTSLIPLSSSSPAVSTSMVISRS